MRLQLYWRSLLFLLFSHVIIIAAVFLFPGLTQDLLAYLPFNTTAVPAAMSAAVASARPAFLSRSITLSSPSYRAGKPQRKEVARAYRVFLDPTIQRSIRRSLDPYRVSTRSLSSSARAAQSQASSAIPHISLHIAASSSGKSRKFKPELNTFDFTPKSDDALGLQKGRNMEEKRKRRPDSGEDAYFASTVGGTSTNVTAFAIADGVGGWNNLGVDPADFSHGLCSHMASRALSWPADGPILSPRHLLKVGYDATVADPDIAGGGTTACVAVTSPDGRMRIVNLGDSGFLQLRLGTVHHYSDPQTHAFNTPYQMSVTPPHILAQQKMFGGGQSISDTPDAADLADHMLRHGDVLILATDGVWDNLDAQDVLKIVSKIMRDTGAWELNETAGYSVADKIASLVTRDEIQTRNMQATLQAVIAAAIAGEAKSAGLNEKRDGPFAKAVMKEYPFEPYRGGKPDDIAVLVVVPVDLDRAQQGEQLKAKL